MGPFVKQVSNKQRRIGKGLKMKYELTDKNYDVETVAIEQTKGKNNDNFERWIDQKSQAVARR